MIVSYDNGRAFELTEALSRLNQVESNIARQERVLSTSLSQLARYTKKTSMNIHYKILFLHRIRMLF